MSFTDQKPRIATREDCFIVRWSGGGPGEKFFCHLCGHKFVPGDQWRWVYQNSSPNPGNCLVCNDCDDTNENIVELRRKACAEIQKYHREYAEMIIATQLIKERSKNDKA
jgi:hypothetical protein